MKTQKFDSLAVCVCVLYSECVTILTVSFCCCLLTLKISHTPLSNCKAACMIAQSSGNPCHVTKTISSEGLLKKQNKKKLMFQSELKETAGCRAVWWFSSLSVLKCSLRYQI